MFLPVPTEARNVTIFIGLPLLHHVSVLAFGHIWWPSISNLFEVPLMLHTSTVRWPIRFCSLERSSGARGRRNWRISTLGLPCPLHFLQYDYELHYKADERERWNEVRQGKSIQFCTSNIRHCQTNTKVRRRMRQKRPDSRYHVILSCPFESG